MEGIDPIALNVAECLRQIDEVHREMVTATARRQTMFAKGDRLHAALRELLRTQAAQDE